MAPQDCGYAFSATTMLVDEDAALGKPGDGRGARLRQEPLSTVLPDKGQQVDSAKRSDSVIEGQLSPWVSEAWLEHQRVQPSELVVVAGIAVTPWSE
eukprot:13780079-Alexandrium_andersonii.AAC.1